MHCASGKCTFDQSPNHDSNPKTNSNLNPNPNPNRNRNPIPDSIPTLNLTSTRCHACMQVGEMRTFDRTRCAFGQMRNLPNVYSSAMKRKLCHFSPASATRAGSVQRKSNLTQHENRFYLLH